MPTDTIYYNKENEIFSDIRHLSNIDNYLIITQKSKDTLFQVLNMKNDSVVAGLDVLGMHVTNLLQLPEPYTAEEIKMAHPCCTCLMAYAQKLLI